MQSVREPRVGMPVADDAPTLAAGAEAWSQLAAGLDERARLDARIVALAGRGQRSGTIERIEGLTLDATLSLTHRPPRCERSMLLTAADVLADMPATRRLFGRAVVSWGQVRGIVVHARRPTRSQRAVLDERIGASEGFFPGSIPMTR